MRLGLAWLAWYVSHSCCCINPGRSRCSAAILLDGSSSVGSFYSPSGRSGQRSSAFGESPAICSGCSMRSCNFARCQSAQCYPGSPCGIGLQVDKADPLSEGWRKLGTMGGCRPLASTKPMDEHNTRPHCNSSFKWGHRGEEAEAFISGGPGGRQRVHHRFRPLEGKAVPKIPRCYGWPSRGRMRTNIRATFGFTSKGVHPSEPPIHRFWCIWTVWETVGRLLRSWKFKTYVLTPEGYTTKEIPGPANFAVWRSSYRVFKTAMIIMDMISVANLMSYEGMVEKYSVTYPQAWHLVVIAEDNARAEHAARLKTRLLASLASGGSPPAKWDPARPWDYIFRLLIEDERYWREQLHTPALAWQGAREVFQSRCPRRCPCHTWRKA